jgi:hypothetical protein
MREKSQDTDLPRGGWRAEYLKGQGLMCIIAEGVWCRSGRPIRDERARLDRANHDPLSARGRMINNRRPRFYQRRGMLL